MIEQILITVVITAVFIRYLYVRPNIDCPECSDIDMDDVDIEYEEQDIHCSNCSSKFFRPKETRIEYIKKYWKYIR